MNSLSRKSIKEITLVAVLAVLLFVQEEVLTFLPNIQLTVFLIVLYSKKLGLKLTTYIILVHVILDNLALGSFNLVFTPFMFIGWELIPISLNVVFKKADSEIHLAMLGILFSLLYCWIYVIPVHLVYSIDIRAYLASDLIFELLLSLSSFISILWLYNPCSKVLSILINRTSDQNN